MGMFGQQSVITTVGMVQDDNDSNAERPRPTKKVRFSAKHTLECRKIAADEKFDIWWTPREFQAIRSEAKLITREIRECEPHIIADIEHTYTTALHLSCTLDDSSYDSLLRDPSGYSGCLREWNDDSCGGRGLEKYTSMKHRYERSAFAKEARAAVIRLHNNPDLHPHEIAAFYKDYSRASCIYARLTGVSDAEIIKESESIAMDTCSVATPKDHAHIRSSFNLPSPTSSMAMLDCIAETKESNPFVSQRDIPNLGGVSSGNPFLFFTD